MSGKKRTRIEASAKWISPSLILNTCCDNFGLTFANVISESRKRELVIARSTAMYFMKMFTGLTLENIGKKFNNRDHSTVMHALLAMTNLYQTNLEYRQKFESIKEILEQL